MLKFLLLPFLFLTLGAAPAVRTAPADDEPTGKVTAVEGNLVTMEVTGELQVWMKKGAYLRATNAEGKAILRGAKIHDIKGTVVIVTTTRAKDMTVGEVYKLARGKASAGC
ncbi:MAG: hypothetical protein FJ363_00690 [Gemmatimonadetes bacterium]|nr:hypothetical protein [Gemmatimonadota bacterium]